MPIDTGFFIGLIVLSSSLICAVHLLRARVTLGPVFAVSGILMLLMWQMRQLGWWSEWGGLQVDTALVGLVPPLLSGLILVYGMDGIRAARAYLLILVTTSLIGWGFAELRDELAQHIPIPYAFELSVWSNLGVTVGGWCGALVAMVAYEGLRRWLFPLAMPLALYLGILGYLVPSSFIEYGAQAGWVNIRAQLPEFALFSMFPAVLLLIYGLFARRQRELVPPRPMSDLFRIWRSAESNLQASRQDVVEARRIISDLRQLNQALAESERIKQYQVMHSPLGVIYTDLRGRINFANPAALKLLGQPDANLDGEHLANLFPSERVPELHALAVTHQVPVLKLQKPDGGTVRCELTTMQLFGAAGECTGYHLLLKDVTAHHQAQRLRRIEEKVKGIHQTGRVIVHDFSNLLLGMQGRLADLEHAFTERKANSFEQGLQTLKQGIKRGRELLRQLGAGEVFSQPRLETVELATLLTEAVNICQATAREKSVTIRRQPFAEVLVKADPAQITRVFTNLLLNAIRATPQNGWVSLEISEDGEGGKLQICDSGPGMSDEQIERAFEPGYSSKGEGQGGLGLSIAYLIVDAHAGFLRLRPNQPHGLCASVWLPRAMTRELSFLSQMKVLLHFSEPRQAQLLLEQLSPLAPDSLAETRSWDELIAVLAEDHWHVLITDLQPPELSGMQDMTVLTCTPEEGRCQVTRPGSLAPSDTESLIRHFGWHIPAAG